MARNLFLDMLLGDGFMGDRAHDPWGEVVLTITDVCFALTWTGYGDLIPFEFNVGALFDECFETHEDYERARDVLRLMTTYGQYIEASDIEFTLRVLARYIDLCKVAGRDY